MSTLNAAPWGSGTAPEPYRNIASLGCHVSARAGPRYNGEMNRLVGTDQRAAAAR